MKAPTVTDRVTTRLTEFGLLTAAREWVPRFTQAHQQASFPVTLDVLDLEAEERQHRRIARLRHASRLPPGKTFDTLEETRFPVALLQQCHALVTGTFLETATNVLAFGLPGVGKSHMLAAIGHALVDAGHRVLFAPAYALVQELLAAKHAFDLPRALRKLDLVEALVIDDLGYVQQSPEEAEVLFTLLAERYERRSTLITSNLVFSEWQRIFKDPMATAAAIDRLVHHAVILEFDVASYRTDKTRKAPAPRPSPKRGRPPGPLIARRK
ncbi:MAG TPA: IS21-like element helper ATPase IstB [Tepidiformaceae bacterium]|nr:IS21-like element helper ATPase IstB [Tepidiformaceae bacterium]